MGIAVNTEEVYTIDIDFMNPVMKFHDHPFFYFEYGMGV
jgi:hypothetical protein